MPGIEAPKMVSLCDDQSYYSDIWSVGLCLFSPVVAAHAVTLHHDATAHCPADLVVGDQNVPAALGEDAVGAPVPRDAAPVKVVVGDCDVLDLLVATLQETVVADVGEDVPLDHHLGALGDKQASHGGVGDLAVANSHV